MDKYIEKYCKGEFALPLLLKIAEDHNIKYTLNKTYGGRCAIFHFPSGNYIMWDSPFNINPSGSVKVCTHKDICTSLLGQNGFSVPKSFNYTLRSKENKEVMDKYLTDFLNNFETSGLKYPIVLKPSTMSQGIGVFVIHNYDEGIEAIKECLKLKEKTFIFQEYCEGNDYRIVILNGEIIQAYQRVPFCIVGDGKRSIKELIIAKAKEFLDSDRDKRIDVEDPRIYKKIKNDGYSVNDILRENKKINLQEIANLSLGGCSIDVLDDLSLKIKRELIEAAKLLNLDMCGIDVISKEISNPNEEYRILEINSAPGIDNYLYSDMEKQERYVYSLYEKIFNFIETKLEKENQIKRSR